MRCVSEGKSEEALEGDKPPSNDLDFATVVSQEFETKFKVTVDRLIRDSAAAEKAAGEGGGEASISSDAAGVSSEHDLETDRSETEDALTEKGRKGKEDTEDAVTEGGGRSSGRESKQNGSSSSSSKEKRERKARKGKE